MGCDIHLYLEARRTKGSFLRRLLFPKNKEWGKVGPDPIYTRGRNYALFKALCGVRSRTDFTLCVSLPKGIPPDMSIEMRETMKELEKNYTLHHHSYNTLRELKEFDWEAYGESMVWFFFEVIPKIEAVGGKDTDVRIVYFFDN